MKAIDAMPNRKVQANCETADTGWAGGAANHTTPRMTASIKTLIPMPFQFTVANDKEGGTNLPGCWACNDFPRSVRYWTLSAQPAFGTASR